MLPASVESHRPTTPPSKNPHNLLPLRRPATGAFHKAVLSSGALQSPTPSLGSAASQRPFPRGASLPCTIDPHRHLNSWPLTGAELAASDSRMQPTEGSPWQGPSLGLHVPTAAQHRAHISMWTKTIAWTQLSLPQEDGARVKTAEGCPS